MHRQLVRSELFPLLDKLIFVAFVLLLPFALGSARENFSDGDVSWHIAAGQWILSHGKMPFTDPFSYTMAGQPWVAFEWLSQVIYALAFGWAGYPGVATVMVLAVMALHLIVYQFLRNRVGPVAMLTAFVAMDAVLTPFLLARPHVLVWPVAAAWTAMLINCREKDRAPPLPLALLMVLWANLHGSFVIGLLVVGAVGFDAIIAAKWNRRALIEWVVFGLVATLASLLNANGLAGFVHPFTVIGLENLALIKEWKPSNPSDTPLFFIVLVYSLAALLLRGRKLAFGELTLLLFLLSLSFLQMRQQAWLAIVAPLILVPKFASRHSGTTAQIASAPSDRRWFAVGAIAGLLLLALRLAIPIQPVENMANPRVLLAHVPVELRSRPVFNGYSFGGPLILAGIKPYIDGRSDMYGDAFMADYTKITDGDFARFDQVVRKYGIRWTLLPPTMKLTSALDASPHWYRLYESKVGVIHVLKPENDR